MFEDWNDDDWCEFDNYMVGCLQGFLNTGLVKSKFVNLKIRQLSAETCHDFIEWCGLVENMGDEQRLYPEIRYYKNDLYFDFINEYPDYGPKAKMTISRTRFYKWLNSYALFQEGIAPTEGRDDKGRWIIINKKRVEPTEEPTPPDLFDEYEAD
jgi:hypothetical protein